MPNFSNSVNQVIYHSKLWAKKQGRTEVETVQLFMGCDSWSAMHDQSNEQVSIANTLKSVYAKHNINRQDVKAVYEACYPEINNNNIDINNITNVDEVSDVMYRLDKLQPKDSIKYVRDLIRLLFSQEAKEYTLYKIFFNELRIHMKNTSGDLLNVDRLYDDMVEAFAPITVNFASIDKCEFLSSLTEHAVNNPYPIIGVDDYVNKMLMCLNTLDKENIMLVGEAGTGKTSIVEKFAKTLALNDIADPKLREAFNDKKGYVVFSLNMNKFNANTGLVGIMERQLDEIVSLSEGKKVYIYIDEIHQATEGHGGVKQSNILDKLKPAISSGKIKLIGSTTEAEYNRYIAKDKALARRFHKIIVTEPEDSVTLEILKNIKHIYENKFNVKIDDSLLDKIVKQPMSYGNLVRNPDRSKSYLGLAVSYAATYDRGVTDVTIEHLHKALEKLNDLKPTDASIKRVSNMLNERILGQEDAVKEVCIKLAGIRAKATYKNKPKALFIFAGPTGVGKTEMAKAIAEIEFGTSKAYTCIDMLEYSSEHDKSGLIGATPGFVGYDDGAKLTNAIKNNPRQVILFDEIEKAHPKVVRVLQTLFDTGRITDASGTVLDASECILICTTNLGYEDAKGFTNEQKHTSEDVVKAIKKFFPQDFRSRFTNVVLFNRLTDDIVDKLIARNIDTLNSVSEYKHTFTEEDIKEIKQMSNIEVLGARDVAKATSTMFDIKEYNRVMEEE